MRDPLIVQLHGSFNVEPRTTNDRWRLSANPDEKVLFVYSRLSRATLESIRRCDKILDRDINANYFTTELYIDLFKIVLIVVKILTESVIIAPVW